MVSSLTTDCCLQTWFFRFIVHLAHANFYKPKFQSCEECFSPKPKVVILKPRIVIDKLRIAGYYPRFIVQTMVLTSKTLVYRIIVHLACQYPVLCL